MTIDTYDGRFHILLIFNRIVEYSNAVIPFSISSMHDTKGTKYRFT